MKMDKRFLVEVGMKDLPFPMRVQSKADPEGQATVASIDIRARIMREFEARWIDTFIQVLHQHRERIGTRTLRTNILDYLKKLKADMVRVDFRYPFFAAKETPVSREKCLVCYRCTYSVKVAAADAHPKTFFAIEIPVITTYPGSSDRVPGGLFGQLSLVEIEVESEKEVYPEDLVELTDRQALAPVYSYLTPEDQLAIITRVHSEAKTSVAMADGIRAELARRKSIHWYSVRVANFGMLHSYSTVIQTEKSMWVPFSGGDEEP